ncbi:MAG: DUF4278 domain-containing protein [Gloeocapsa sp. DLM2.Bin57]|nr:MAG: DUF4278 domain-containing protein [Gloeocapsa sp. DLM2.Bin57]
MKQLSYRGISYDYENANIEFDQGEIGGKYRGKDWKYRYPKHIVHLKPKIYRQYRGVAYSTCPTPLQESQVNPHTHNPAQDNRCSVQPQKQLQKQTSAQIHWENMRKNLERRLQAAQARGDVELVTMLEKESRELSLF